MYKKNFLIGIAGYGSIAKLHINIILKNFKNAKIILFRKKYINKLDKIHVNRFLEENINNIQKYELTHLIIANPASYHYEVLKNVYKNKYKIFIEKPIFDKFYKSNFIIKYRNNIQNNLYVGYVFRHDQVINYYKKLLSKISLSKKTFIEIVCETDLKKWRKRTNYKNDISLKKQLGGGAILELSHEIDYCLYFFGKPIKVYSYLINSKTFPSGDVEDMANITFIYKNGLKINIRLQLNSDKEKRYCKILNNSNIYLMDLIKRKIFTKINNKNNSRSFHDSIYDSYSKQISLFINTVKDSKIIKKNTQDALYVIKIIEKLRKSNQNNRVVNL